MAGSSKLIINPTMKTAATSASSLKSPRQPSLVA
jgi:hypothetical protein